MTRYAIIGLALMVGIFIGWLLSRPRKAADETVFVDARQKYWYLPWVGGFTVLIIGLFLLADPSRAPKDSQYNPATIKDGVISPGTFTQDDTTQDKAD